MTLNKYYLENKGTCSDPSITEWQMINWPSVNRRVQKLQRRIAKAVREQRWNLVRDLQHVLTRSFSAKLLAVKKVTSNRGKRTPGVDGVTWSAPKTKLRAAYSLSSKGYKASPLRRVLIPKSNGKMRPLSIPTLFDRAMQALYAFALLPEAETIAAPNSYGFRPKRAAADAIEQCFKTLAIPGAAQWILEADIEACFDNIDQAWLEQHIPIERSVFRQWLKSGFIENKQLFPTTKGVPQGGIISPIISNWVLDGLERTLNDYLPKTTLRYRRAKVHIIRYADDFIITASSKKILESEILPLIKSCLAVRGLKLSVEKTRITHIDQGFDFLGQNVRKYNGKLLIKPSIKSQQAFKKKVREIMKRLKSAPQSQVIKKLNPVIRGWGQYHRHVVSSVVFSKLDAWIWKILWRWSTRRHPKKAKSWIKDKYFIRDGTRDWIFADKSPPNMKNRSVTPDDKKTSPSLRLLFMSSIWIRRHIKIKSEANPFDSKWDEYFDKRLSRKMIYDMTKTLRKLWNRQSGKCLVCKQVITVKTFWRKHAIKINQTASANTLPFYILLHPKCHHDIEINELPDLAYTLQGFSEA